MSIQLGQMAPDFTADSTLGPIDFHNWSNGQWVVLFSHPKDFTPVCTTELGKLARRKQEFDQRNTKVIGLSANSANEHKAWIADIARISGAPVEYPILADPDMRIAKLYGMVHPAIDTDFTIRSVFIIGPDHRVRLTINYPPRIGRNIDEILRALTALQQSDKQDVLIPADWKPHEYVIARPSLTEAEVYRAAHGKVKKVTEYLRYIPTAA